MAPLLAYDWPCVVLDADPPSQLDGGILELLLALCFVEPGGEPLGPWYAALPAVLAHTALLWILLSPLGLVLRGGGRLLVRLGAVLAR